MNVDHYDFDPQKSERLRQERGIGFEEVITLIEAGKLVRALKNSNPKYPHQFIFEVDIDGYVYIVPFIVDGSCAYLKTIYPSRKATKRHRRKT